MNAFIVAKRDLLAFFNGMWGWTVLAAILVIDGLFFNVLAMDDSARRSHEVLEQFFYNTGGATLVASVLLTMRSFAEERQLGTDVIYETSPISDGAVVFGKWLASMGMLGLLTLLTLYMPALIFVNGKVALGHIAVGYVGLLAMGGAGAAIGVFASSLVRSQVFAGVLAGVMVVTMVIFWYLADKTDAPFRDVIEGMALFENFMPFLEGRLLTEKLVFYGSVIFGSLFLSARVLEARRWR